MVTGTADSEAGTFDAAWTAGTMDAMERFNDKLRDAGMRVMAESLAASAAGKRIAFDGASRLVSDGPFARRTNLSQVSGYGGLPMSMRRLPWQNVVRTPC